ncbi:MAG: bifunctional riboflavin kinase/FAD synthetase [Deltaproteobacteria bacterium]|nr:bifunctional riboflavin kinase/FAD synthetase [Deltaproteobacteria bacterium]
MQIITDLKAIEEPLINPVLTIGNFDGVHRGHLALFEKVRQRAQAIQGRSAVMTFEPHPFRVMKPGNGPPLITPTKQKIELIQQAGIDLLFCIPFTREFADISAEDFVGNILVAGIGIKELVVGYDYAFGRDREGNIPLLKKMGEKFGFLVHLVQPIHVDEMLVSSTSIRRLIQEGRLAEAKTLLGRNFQLEGSVVRGHNRGAALLGFPTANLSPQDELLPKTGVYAVTVLIDGKPYSGVTNVGYNPTFRDKFLSVETHLLNFSRDILGKKIKLTFLHRLRDEKTFKSVQELIDQISRDIHEAREWFEGRAFEPLKCCVSAASSG